MCAILPHMMWLSANLQCMSEMLAENTARKNYAKKNCDLCTTAQHCRAISSQLRLKNLLSSNISFTCPHNMGNFGPLTPEIGSGVWGTPANFKGFRILASLLQRRRSLEANQTLHNAWPFPGQVHYIPYIFGGFCPVTEFCHVQSSLYVQVFRSLILAALLHGTRAAGVSQTLLSGTRNGITELYNVLMCR